MNKCGAFLGELLRTRDILHIAHLKAKNMAEHTILQDLYEEILDEFDEIAELRLARGRVDIVVEDSDGDIDVVSFLEEDFVPMLDEMKEHADDKGFNDIGAEIDELKSISMHSLYKLKNLADRDNDEDDTDDDDDLVGGGILYKRNKKNSPRLIRSKCGGGKTGRRCGGGKI